MALSIGRTLYNLTGRREPGAEAARPARPLGELIWLHAPESACGRGLLQLARRLIDTLGVEVLLTCPDDLPVGRGMIRQPPPPDSAAEVKSFLAHWQPQMAIMAEGEVRPALLLEAEQRRLPDVMDDARAPYLL